MLSKVCSKTLKDKAIRRYREMIGAEIKIPTRTKIAMAGTCGKMDSERGPVKAQHLQLDGSKR